MQVVSQKSLQQIEPFTQLAAKREEVADSSGQAMQGHAMQNCLGVLFLEGHTMQVMP